MDIVSLLLAPLATGFAVWGATEWIKIRKQRLVFLNDLSAYKGAWHGVHYTRLRDDPSVRLSRHSYRLSVSSSGAIAGSFEDQAPSPTMIYRVNGAILPGCIVLTSRSSSRPHLFATEVYFLPLDLERLEGVIASYDYADRPFVGPIVLTREALADSDARVALQHSRERFFQRDDDVAMKAAPNPPSQPTPGGRARLNGISLDEH